MDFFISFYSNKIHLLSLFSFSHNISVLQSFILKHFQINLHRYDFNVLAQSTFRRFREYILHIPISLPISPDTPTMYR